MSKIVQCCPACESTKLNERTSARYDADERWLCRACRNEFGTPDRRRSRAAGGYIHPLGQAAKDADPDMVSGEDNSWRRYYRRRDRDGRGEA